MELGVRVLGTSWDSPYKNSASRTVPIPLPAGSGHVEFRTQVSGSGRDRPFCVPSWGKPFPTPPHLLSLSSAWPWHSVFPCDNGLFTSLSSPQSGIFSGQGLGLIDLSIARAASWHWIVVFK